MSATLNTKVCPKCGAPLSYTSSGEGYCAFTGCLLNTNDFCPLPGQEDQSARLAVSAEVDQVVDTQLDHARFASWLLGELFLLAPDDSPEEQALNRAFNDQESRVLHLEIAADLRLFK